MNKILLFIGIVLSAAIGSPAQKLFGGDFERQAAQSLAGQNFSYRFACTFYADEAGKEAMPAQLRFRIFRKRDNWVMREFMGVKNPDPQKITVPNECTSGGASAQVEHYSVLYTYETIINPYEFNDRDGYYVVNDAPAVLRAPNANLSSSKLVLYHWFSSDYLFEKLDNADQGRAATGLTGAYAFMCKGEGKNLRLQLDVAPLVKIFDPQALDLTARTGVPLTDGALPFQEASWKTGFNGNQPNGSELYVVDSKPKFDNNSEVSHFSAWTVPPQNGVFTMCFVTELRRNGTKLAENSLEMFAEVGDCKRSGYVTLNITETATGQPAGASFCRDKPIQLNAKATEEGLQYQWYRDQQPISGATGLVLKIEESGHYFLKAKKEGACSESTTMTVNATAINCQKIGPPAILGNNIHDMMSSTGPSATGYLNNHAFRAIYYTPLSDLAKMPKQIRATVFRKRDQQRMDEITLKRNTFADLTNLLTRLCDNGKDSIQEVAYESSIEFTADRYSDPQGYYLAAEPVCCRVDADNLAQTNSSVVTYLELGPANQVKAHNTIQRGHTVDLSIPFTLKTCVNQPVRVFVYAGNRENVTAQFGGFAELMMGNENTSGFRTMGWAPGYSADNFTGNVQKLIVEPRRNGLMIMTGVPEKPGIFVYRLRIDGTTQGQIYSTVYQEFRLEVNDCTPAPKPQVFVSKVGQPNVSASAELCQDSLVQLNLRNFRNWAKLQWSLGKATLANATDSVLIVPKNQSGFYTCAIKMPRQCPEVINTDPQKITYFPRPSVLLTSPIAVACEGQNIPLAAKSDAVGGSFQWFLDDKLREKTTQPALVATETGAYTVRVTDAKGCSNTSLPFKATINALPQADIIAPKDYVCQGQSLVLTASNGGNSYQWYKDNQPVGSNGGQLSITEKANYSVKITNGFGCSATSKPVVIQQISSPTASIVIPDKPSCLGHFIISAQTNAAAPQYQWLFDNKSKIDSTKTTYLATETGTYTLRITDSKGCVGNALPQKLVITFPAKADITAPKNFFCEGKDVILKASLGSSYQWFRDNEPLANTQQITVSTVANYSVKVTNESGCFAVSTPVLIQKMSNPTAAITAPDNQFCQGQSLILTAQTAATIPKYEWLRENLPQAGSIYETFAAQTAGNYVVRITDVNGCTTQSPAQTLKLNPLPEAKVQAARPTVCEGKTLDLTATVGTGYTYEWSKDGKNLGEQNSLLKVSGAGSYSVVVTTPLKCAATSNNFAVQRVKNPEVLLTAPTNRVCEGTPLSLSATGNDLRSFEWLQDGKSVKQGSDATLSVQKTGSYVVIVKDQNDCATASVPFAAEVLAQVVVRIDSVPGFCGIAFAPVGLQGSPTAGEFTGKGVLNSTFAPRVAGIGQHVITYTVRGDLACLNGTAQKTVVIRAAPSLDLGEERELFRGSSTRLNADMGKGYTYIWEPAIWINDATAAKPKVDPDNDIYYRVLATGPDNCVSEDSIKIKVVQRVFVPEIFSPNADGLNDTWRIIGIESYPEIEVMIYNRWGNLVFYGKGSNQEPFDGTSRGEPLTEGVYVYSIRAKPGGHVDRGQVIISR